MKTHKKGVGATNTHSRFKSNRTL